MAKIELKSIRDLLQERFFVPDYQRGYRWGQQQVKDLLEDLSEFIESDEFADGFYCLQPLVVRETVDQVDAFLERLPKNASEDALAQVKKVLSESVEWEVIDGQQRLTTVRILLFYLRVESCYDIRYARIGETLKLLLLNEDKTTEKSKKSIDNWYIHEAWKAIRGWFDKMGSDSERFKNALLDKVRFIWYETDEDPIKVFTRLNIGKIGLTNSELIKSLLLNKSNFKGCEDETIRLRQLEIATEWDRIEAMLQSDEFWMFLHKPGYEKPTRIDYLFDLVVKLKLLDGAEMAEMEIGKDAYRTFRYFNAYLQSENVKPSEDGGDAPKGLPSRVELCWRCVSGLFATFLEWFNDLELYHYIGFLVDRGVQIDEIVKKWKVCKEKSMFLERCVVPAISEILRNDGCCNLDETYEVDGKAKKTKCKSLLLLHNLQTVIDQNKQNGDSTRVFYKFPFHLYKTERWDIEHVDSNTENDLGEKNSQNEFLINRFNAVGEDLQKGIESFVSNPNATNFDDLKDRIERLLGKGSENDRLDDEEKNKVWNFVLLDSSTNRSYGNAIFSAKRRIIIGKDQGLYIPVPRLVKGDDGSSLKQTERQAAPSAFIPPCTKQVFFKYYSPVVASPNFWLKTDAEGYRKDIKTKLEKFGVYSREEND